MLDYYNYTVSTVSIRGNVSVVRGSEKRTRFPLQRIPPEYAGFDLWDNLQPARSYVGQYATELFTRKSVELIQQHDYKKVRKQFQKPNFAVAFHSYK